jgi:hypothetical protein
MGKAKKSEIERDDSAAKCRRQIVYATVVGAMIVIALWRIGVWLGFVSK